MSPTVQLRREQGWSVRRRRETEAYKDTDERRRGGGDSTLFSAINDQHHPRMHFNINTRCFVVQSRFFIERTANMNIRHQNKQDEDHVTSTGDVKCL